MKFIVIGFVFALLAVGFTTEQICVAAVGVGVVAKGSKIAEVVTKVTLGQEITTVLTDTVKSVQAFKTKSVDFAINAAQKTLRTEQLAKSASQMADAVSKLSYGGGQTVGDVITTFVERLDIIHEELAKIGHPLDSFGIKTHAQLAKLLSRDLGVYPGEQAIRGNIRLFDKLVVGSGDRYDDFVQLFKKADGTLDKDNLKASLETFKDATDATTTQPKFYLKNPEVAHPNGYRYMDDITLIQQNGNKLPVHSGDGWYCSFDEYSQSADAVSKLQLPAGSAGKYRVEFATESVKGNVRIPYGHKQEYEWFEPLTRDYPNLGNGGGTQVLISDTEIPITAIWDVSGATPIRIY